MNNQAKTTILNYAEIQPHFSLGDLHTYAHARIGVANATLSWYLHQLVREGKLCRVGRGLYRKVNQPVFTPHVTPSLQNLHATLRTNFPFSSFCLYEGQELQRFQHHLSPNQITYVETDRDAAESVSHFLQQQNYKVYLRPTHEMLARFIPLSEPAIFVKPLVTEAPLQHVDGVPMPTLEKLLVDIRCDDDFFYLQGYECLRMTESAYNLCPINRDKLLRYAARRHVKQELLADLEYLHIT
jgi:hypothetical protein